MTINSYARFSGFSILATVVLGVTIASPAALAAEYYISPNGSDWSSGTSPAEPWRTIAKANGRVRAGDTVYLMGGDFVDDPIAPVRSGAPGNPITYTRMPGETPVITSYRTQALNYAMYLQNVSHIVIERINVTGRQRSPGVTVRHFVQFDNASYNEVKDCNFQYAYGWAGVNFENNSHHNRFVRNTIDFVGMYNFEGQDYGDGIYIARGNNYNLIASNVVTHAAHNLLHAEGSRNIIQDNIFDNDWSDVMGAGTGGRNVEISGTNDVFQRNIVRNASRSIDAPKNAGMKVEGTANIVRRNLIVGNHHDAVQTETGSWQSFARDNRIYNNTIFGNGAAAWRVRYYDGSSWPRGNVFKNNIVYGNRLDPRDNVEDTDFRLILQGSGQSGVADNRVINNLVAKTRESDARVFLSPPQEIVALGDAESRLPGNFRNNIQAVPQFVATQPAGFEDFDLSPGSPGIDQGAPLTTARGAGNGTVVGLEDASYFSDGSGLQPGDLVRVGNNGPARIVRVDYRTNEIEVERSISWLAGDPVSSDYEGSALDIGAVEHGTLGLSDSTPRPPKLSVVSAY